jgi:hypothetical protein
MRSRKEMDCFEQLKMVKKLSFDQGCNHDWDNNWLTVETKFWSILWSSQFICDREVWDRSDSLVQASTDKINHSEESWYIMIQSISQM